MRLILKTKASLCTLFFLALSASLQAKAEVHLAVEGSSVQGSMSSSVNTTQTQSLLEADALIGLGSKSRFYFGMMYLTYGNNEKDTAGTESVFLTQDYFAGGKVFFDRDRRFSLTVAYGILATATYKLGNAAVETWSGTSQLFKVSYYPHLSDRWAAGLSLTYYSATYIKKDVSGVSSSFSGSKSFLLPALGFSFSF